MKVIKDIRGSGIIFTLVRVPGSSRVLFGGSDFKVYDLDLSASKPEPKALGEHQSYVTGLALAGKTVVSGGYDGRLIWWDIEARKQIRTIEAHTKWIRKVAIISNHGLRAGGEQVDLELERRLNMSLADLELSVRAMNCLKSEGITTVRERVSRKIIASVGDDMVCRLWNAADGKVLHELRGHYEKTPHHFPSMLFVCAFAPDGRFVATADKVGHIVVWETASGKPVKTLEAPGMYTWDPVQRKHSIGGIRSLAFSTDGKYLACGGIGKIGNIDHLDGKARIEIFDWHKGEKTHEHADGKFKGMVEHLAFHPNGDWLIGGGGANDGFVLIFDLKSKKAIRQEKAAMHIHAFTLDDKAETMYAAGHGRIQMLDIKS